MSQSTQQTPNTTGADVRSAPGFWRCMAAILYDFLLLLAVLFLATALLLPFNAGEAFTSSQIFYPVYLSIISFVFYGWFWTHGGQTLGLRAWNIKVLTLDQKPISWQLAFLRFMAALLSWLMFGLGFVWIVIDKNKYSWHDHLSKTALFLQSNAK
nr:RDD family protein [Crenothrix polyspora]